MEYTYIYCLLDPDGCVKYIGKSDDPQKRYVDHLRKSKYIKNYKDRWIYGLLKLSKKPELFIIDYVPFNEFGFWEDFYIQLFKSWGFKLTNLAPGGGGGNFGQDINRKISEKLKGRKFSNEWKNNLSKSKIGKKASLETCIKFSSMRKGERNPMFGVIRNKEWDESKRKKIKQLTLDGKYIRNWNSINDAVKETNINRTSINSVLSNKRNHAGGYKWQYDNIY